MEYTHLYFLEERLSLCGSQTPQCIVNALQSRLAGGHLGTDLALGGHQLLEDICVHAEELLHLLHPLSQLALHHLQQGGKQRLSGHQDSMAGTEL